MDDDHDPLDGASKRNVLRTIAAYRDLCRAVSRGSTSGLIFGAMMLAIWYFGIPNPEKFGIFGSIYLGLAALEFTVAMWNKLAPSAEGVLLEGLVLMGFGAMNLVRVYLRVQAGQKNEIYFGLFGLYMLYSGFKHVQSYQLLRQAFADRPSADLLRWFDGLVRDTHQADPEADPEVLDLPTRPPVKVKFLDDTAIAVFPGSSDVAIAGREDVELQAEPHEDPDKLPKGFLLLNGDEYGPFPLHPENWKNYSKWKAAGGTPPPPLAVRGFDR